ncbi:MAG TPA: FHIPEP family type III secretion protein, partial [bacterium]|nr:FHIPEP family type III secretion protein [bacterium]
HAPDLLDRQAVQRLIDRLRETHTVLVNELVPDLLTVGQIQKVLQMLLRERVCIRDLGTVLEALADAAHATRDIAQLTELVRTALARPLTQSFLAPDGNLYVMTLEPRLEQTLVEAIQKSTEGTYLTLDPQVSRKLLERIGEEMEKVAARGFQTVLLTNPQLRPHLHALVERFLPHLVVMSYTEVASDAKVQSSGVVRWEPAAQEARR